MGEAKSRILVNAAVFGGVAVLWVLADRLSKGVADQGAVGDLLWEGIPGILELRLVHNTGAAWGMFGDSTLALGVFAIVFCLALAVLAHIRRERASAIEMLGYGLVLGGGIGNAIDRFANGYVVDFIEATFVDFPVFNVADIGVTCGFVVIIAAYLLAEGSSGRRDG